MKKCVGDSVVSNVVLCLMGPTASGKTDLACELSSNLSLEIVSVDSALIYREMNIGTAKPTPEILSQYPHHLIDIRTPIETYSAAAFCEDVLRLINDIHARGRTPLLVGGTMMYFRALQNGLNVLPETNPAIRARLADEKEKQGLDGLYDWLKSIDLVTANRLHPHDSQRILRALEVYLSTGEPLSSYFQEQKSKSALHFINAGLFPNERGWLHQRIAERFHGMLRLGFLDEVDQLIQNWPLDPSMPAMRSVGYRQALDYLDGIVDYTGFIDRGIAATRQLAKRQLTWLRGWSEIRLLDPQNLSSTKKDLLCYFEKHTT